MRNQDIHRQIQRINSLISQTSSTYSRNQQMLSEWSRYLCIIIAGFAENSLKILYREYAKSHTDPTVYRYVEIQLNDIRNPKLDRVLKIAKEFNPNLSDRISIYADNNGLGDALNSIMGNRHLIAHGRYGESNISINNLRDYYSKTIQLFEYIEDELGL